MSEPTLRETADRLDEIMEVSSPWIHTKLTPMLRGAANVIEELEDKNAHLRSRLSDEFAENARMTVENAKLWELVRVMAFCMQHERDCDGCRLNGARGTITTPAGCDGLLDRMRELFGKENDGGNLV